MVTVSSIAAKQDVDFDDPNAERGYKSMRSYGMAKLAQLMFASSWIAEAEKPGGAFKSNAAHPGLAKTNLLSGASYGRARPTLQARLTRLTWRLMPFIWLDVDEAIKPTLYAAVSPYADGARYYGPRGFYETAGGGVALAALPRPFAAISTRIWRLWRSSGRS